MSTIQQTNARLYRAYLLTEQLSQIYRLPARAAEQLLDRWLAWARRCRLPSFVKPARTITEQRAGILAAIQHGLSNARIEQINTPIRLIAPRAFGFRSPGPFIALAMLKLAHLYRANYPRKRQETLNRDLGGAQHAYKLHSPAAARLLAGRTRALAPHEVKNPATGLRRTR